MALQKRAVCQHSTTMNSFGNFGEKCNAESIRRAKTQMTDGEMQEPGECETNETVEDALNEVVLRFPIKKAPARNNAPALNTNGTDRLAI
jgi:hypothetical protein